MPQARVLLASVLVLSTLCPASEIVAPPHPTVVYAEYKDRKHVVVAAEKDKPIIVLDGTRLSLPKDTPLFTERAPGYSALEATFSNERSVRSTVRRDRYNVLGSFEERTVEITAAQDLRDCFMVIIHFEEEFLMSDEERVLSRKRNAEIFHDRPVAKPQIHVHQIEDLKAAQVVTTIFSSVISLDPRSTNLPGGVDVTYKTHFIHPLFSEGREVKTNLPEIVGTYFHHREKLLHRAVLANWLKQNAKADQPLRPLLQIPPLIDSLEGMPADATATLSIATDGTVSEVNFDREFPEEAKAILQNTLRAWLFLPRIQQGSPVAAKVKLPLRF
ncbi:MAG: hypothetical protein Q8J74_08655 [Candidatus Didemnitutus sp.]|nr:hypothetical protein [Candidatus Didemnitutus sp.]